MVTAVSQAPSLTWGQAVVIAQQAQIADTTLNPDLQKLADIINDTSGKYSEADKINAYTKQYVSYQSATWDPGSNGARSTGNSDTQRQHQKFDLTIKDSVIGQGVIAGNQKLYTFQRSQAFYADNNATSGFFAGLSDLQKQLPEFKQLASGEASAAEYKDVVALSAESKALFRSIGPIPKTQYPLVAGQQIQSRQSAVADTTLTPALQHLADIINDRTGKYSISEQISAYTTAEVSIRTGGKEIANPLDPLAEPTHDATLDQRLAYDKFLLVIQGSVVADAEADGQQKLQNYVKANGGIVDWRDDQVKFKFFATLTPLEQRLEDFKNFGVPLAKLLEQGAIAFNKIKNEAPSQFVHDQDAAALEAEILFGSADPSKGGASASKPATTETNTLSAAGGNLRVSV